MYIKQTDRQNETEIDLSKTSISIEKFEGFSEAQITEKELTIDVNFCEVAANIGDKPSSKNQYSHETSYEVWHNDMLRIQFRRIGMDRIPSNPDIPPFTVTLEAKEGRSFQIERDRGWSTLQHQSGTILSEGENTISFYNHNSKDLLFTLRITLDQVNDWSFPERPAPSEASRALKKNWNRFWRSPASNENYGFNLEPTKRRPLETKSLDEMRQLSGPGELIREWEEDIQMPLEELYSYDAGCYTFGRDPKTGSYAMLEYSDGESDHRLYIFNASAEYVGVYRVGDDGSRDWLEGFPGEYEKP